MRVQIITARLDRPVEAQDGHARGIICSWCGCIVIRADGGGHVPLDAEGGLPDCMCCYTYWLCKGPHAKQTLDGCIYAPTMTPAPKAAADVTSVRTLAFLEMWFTTR